MRRQEDFLRLDACYARSGNSLRGTSNRIERPTPGVLAISPLASSVSTIWWTEGALTLNYRSRSASLGARRFNFV